MGDWHEDALRHKYDPLPENAPRHRKKAKKKHVRSDHKHEYEQVCIDSHTYVCRHGAKVKCYYIATRCKVCGRVGDVKVSRGLHEPPDGMPLYDVPDFFIVKSLPDEMRVDG